MPVEIFLFHLIPFLGWIGMPAQTARMGIVVVYLKSQGQPREHESLLDVVKDLTRGRSITRDTTRAIQKKGGSSDREKKTEIKRKRFTGKRE